MTLLALRKSFVKGHWRTVNGALQYVNPFNDDRVKHFPVDQGDFHEQAVLPTDPGQGQPDPVSDYQNNGPRAARFKQWFGDWEKGDPSASKIVTKDGPLPVHPINPIQIESENAEPLGGTKNEPFGPGFYFSDKAPEPISKAFEYDQPEHPYNTAMKELYGIIDQKADPQYRGVGFNYGRHWVYPDGTVSKDLHDEEATHADSVDSMLRYVHESPIADGRFQALQQFQVPSGTVRLSMDYGNPQISLFGRPTPYQMTSIQDIQWAKGGKQIGYDLYDPVSNRRIASGDGIRAFDRDVNVNYPKPVIQKAVNQEDQPEHPYNTVMKEFYGTIDERSDPQFREIDGENKDHYASHWIFPDGSVSQDLGENGSDHASSAGEVISASGNPDLAKQLEQQGDDFDYEANPAENEDMSVRPRLHHYQSTTGTIRLAMHNNNPQVQSYTRPTTQQVAKVGTIMDRKGGSSVDYDFYHPDTGLHIASGSGWRQFRQDLEKHYSFQKSMSKAVGDDDKPTDNTVAPEHRAAILEALPKILTGHGLPPLPSALSGQFQQTGNIANLAPPGSPAEPDIKAAHEAAKSAGGPCYLNIRNPFDVTAPLDPQAAQKMVGNDPPLMSAVQQSVMQRTGADAKTWPQEADGGDLIASLLYLKREREISRVLSAGGYDGIVHPERTDSGKQTTFVAFQPQQVKSALNVGTFDPDSDDILKATDYHQSQMSLFPRLIPHGYIQHGQPLEMNPDYRVVHSNLDNYGNRRIAVYHHTGVPIGELDYEASHRSPVAHVNSIWVHPEMQRKGIGRNLYENLRDHLIERHPNITHVSSDVTLRGVLDLQKQVFGRAQHYGGRTAAIQSLPVLSPQDEYGYVGTGAEPLTMRTVVHKLHRPGDLEEVDNGIEVQKAYGPGVQQMAVHPHCKCVIVTHPDGTQEWQVDDDGCAACQSAAEQFNAKQFFKAFRQPAVSLTPEAHAKLPRIDSTAQLGEPVRYRSTLPETLYHVTTSYPELSRDTHLRINRRASTGLGSMRGTGYPHVSFTSNPITADNMHRELLRIGQIARGEVEYPDMESWVHADMGRITDPGARQSMLSNLLDPSLDSRHHDSLPTVYSKLVQKHGQDSLRPILETYQHYLAHRMPSYSEYGMTHKEATAEAQKIGQPWYNAPHRRSDLDTLDNPGMIVDHTNLRFRAGITPETTRVIAIPSHVLPQEPLITHRPVDNGEYRVYGDVPIQGHSLLKAFSFGGDSERASYLAHLAIEGSNKIADGTAPDYESWVKHMQKQDPDLDDEALQGLHERAKNLSGLRFTPHDLLKGIDQQASWKDWYERHEKVLDDMFGDHAPLFQRFLSATSQRNNVAGNVSHALKAFDQYSRGEPFTGYMQPTINNLNRAVANEKMGGEKISQFDQANSGGENAGEGIAVDMHVLELLFGKMPLLDSGRARNHTRAMKRQAQDVIRTIAAKYGWQPREVQATMWAHNQVLRGTKPEDVKSYDTYLNRKADQIRSIREAFNTPTVGNGSTGPGGSPAPSGNPGTGIPGYSGQTPAPGATGVATEPQPPTESILKSLRGILNTAAKQAHPTPTPGQREAGNYRHGHIRLSGLDISIEVPKGGHRVRVGRDGKEIRQKMACHYGFITGYGLAADGDHPDVFVGSNPDSQKVFVIDQVNQDSKWDEHKIMCGFNSLEEARAGYLANYTPGWKCGPVTELTMDGFKAWLRGGGAKNPLSGLILAGVRNRKTLDDMCKALDEVDPFTRLAHAQREEPESAMLRVQRANGGGVLNYLVEHTGDLTHRMSEPATAHNAGYEFVGPKLRRLAFTLERPGAIGSEHAENMRNNADHRKIPLTEQEYGVNAALTKYQQAHMELPVFNEAQRLARDAAIAVGSQSWRAAKSLIDVLKTHHDQGEEHWTRFARAEPDGLNKALEPEHPWVTAAKSHFGTTDNPYLAGYLLRNGEMLDFSGGSLYPGRDVEHGEIGESMPVDSGRWHGSNKIREFMAQTGAARIHHERHKDAGWLNDPGPGLSLIEHNQPLTPAQIRSFVSHSQDNNVEVETTHPDSRDYIIGASVMHPHLRGTVIYALDKGNEWLKSTPPVPQVVREPTDVNSPTIKNQPTQLRAILNAARRSGD